MDRGKKAEAPRRGLFQSDSPPRTEEASSSDHRDVQYFWGINEDIGHSLTVTTVDEDVEEKELSLLNEDELSEVVKESETGPSTSDPGQWLRDNVSVPKLELLSVFKKYEEGDNSENEGEEDTSHPNKKRRLSSSESDAASKVLLSIAVKEEIRCKIQLNRLNTGQEELQVDNSCPEPTISFEAIQKRNEVRNRNKEHAKRSRERKKYNFLSLIKANVALQEEKEQLKYDIGVLKKKVQEAQKWYESHECEEQEVGQDPFAAGPSGAKREATGTSLEEETATLENPRKKSVKIEPPSPSITESPEKLLPPPNLFSYGSNVHQIQPIPQEVRKSEGSSADLLEHGQQNRIDQDLTKVKIDPSMFCISEAISERGFAEAIQDLKNEETE